jgi:3-oxo-5-alpha-steroid 4-dehydrogenase 1
MLLQLHNYLIYGILVLAVLTFFGTLHKVNPYGRHMQAGQGGTWPALPAWLLFESPQWFAFLLTFWWLVDTPSEAQLLLFVLWQCHYVYRAILYPLRMQDRHKRFPVSGVVFGFAFNAANGFINGFAVVHAPHLMSAAWLSDPRLLAGLAIAVTGWWINFQADSILIKLRADGSTGYKIPYGGMFRYVSSANYFGEILLWCGWAMMSWTLAGLTFALFTIANLGPRALSHHRWYRETFPDYPKERKALIPGLL